MLAKAYTNIILYFFTDKKCFCYLFFIFLVILEDFCFEISKNCRIYVIYHKLKHIYIYKTG